MKIVHCTQHLLQNNGSTTMIGTPKFTSINIHQGSQYSRRDDLISLGYLYLYLLKQECLWEPSYDTRSNIAIRSASYSKKSLFAHQLAFRRYLWTEEQTRPIVVACILIRKQKWQASTLVHHVLQYSRLCFVLHYKSER